MASTAPCLSRGEGFGPFCCLRSPYKPGELSGVKWGLEDTPGCDERAADGIWAMHGTRERCHEKSNMGELFSSLMPTWESMISLILTANPRQFLRALTSHGFAGQESLLCSVRRPQSVVLLLSRDGVRGGMERKGCAPTNLKLEQWEDDLGWNYKDFPSSFQSWG